MGKKAVQPAKMQDKFKPQTKKKTAKKTQAPTSTVTAAPPPVQTMTTRSWVISVIHQNKPLSYDQSSILASFSAVKAGRGWGKMEQANLFNGMSEAKYTKLFHHVFYTTFGPSVAHLQHNYIRSYYETLVTTARGKHGKLIAAALKRAEQAGKL
jgi:hypothetical protein